MRFLADMGVSWRVVEHLRGQGYDIIHLRDLGMQELPNGDIFEKAIQEQRIVLTFDLDFGEIISSCSKRIASVILFRLKNTRTDFVISRLEKVLEQSSEALVQGAIVVVDDFRSRVRRLPIGEENTGAE